MLPISRLRHLTLARGCMIAVEYRVGLTSAALHPCRVRFRAISSAPFARSIAGQALDRVRISLGIEAREQRSWSGGASPPAPQCVCAFLLPHMGDWSLVHHEPEVDEERGNVACAQGQQRSRIERDRNCCGQQSDQEEQEVMGVRNPLRPKGAPTNEPWQVILDGG